MSKGSIRQKGSKWYYRFYIEDENGQHIQKEFVGSKSKKETEALLRHALNEYEKHRYIASPGHITVGELLDMWIDENLKSSNKSNGTLMLYQTTVNRIKKHPIAQKKLKSITCNPIWIICISKIQIYLIQKGLWLPVQFVLIVLFFKVLLNTPCFQKNYYPAIPWNMLFPDINNRCPYYSIRIVLKNFIQLHIHSLKTFALI